ncbi:MAG: 2TM domain-containing protein [Hyphomicrobiaceae bacterium]
MKEHEKLALAKRRVEAITGFYIHFAVFAVVMTVLLAVNLLAGNGWWVQWPFLGWGAGVLGHGLIVFGEKPDFIRQWQTRKIEEIKQKL